MTRGLRREWKGAYLKEKTEGQAGGEGVVAYHGFNERGTAGLGEICAYTAVERFW